MTIKLVCTDLHQLQRQMKNRPNNGLIDYALQEKCNTRNLTRPPLINEHPVDITGLSADEVLEKALEILNTAQPLTEYDYVKPGKEQFYSWVFANGLR